jgi:hypothetical protein
MSTNKLTAINRLPAVLIFCLVAVASPGQKLLSMENGSISFTSNAELELIKGWSNSVTGLLNPATNQFAISVAISSFQGFNSTLQQKHFNENYLESSAFPKATFVGKIIEQIDLTAMGHYEVRAKGELTIHGQTQTRIIKIKISTNKEGALAQADFIVPLADHHISIPRIVSRKIAPEIMVDFKGTFFWK